MMKFRFRDASIEVEEMMIQGYRRMTPVEKFRRVVELNSLVRHLAMADIRNKHPHAEKRELMLRMASRWLDSGLMLKAFGWDSNKEGY
jgi:hypothetical protein